MRINVFSLKPYWDSDALFINIDDAPTFDPKHPSIYPGAEVEIVETLTVENALAKYGKESLCFGSDVLYVPVSESGKGKEKIAIVRKTGRTSSDVVTELRG